MDNIHRVVHPIMQVALDLVVLPSDLHTLTLQVFHSIRLQILHPQHDDAFDRHGRPFFDPRVSGSSSRSDHYLDMHVNGDGKPSVFSSSHVWHSFRPVMASI